MKNAVFEPAIRLMNRLRFAYKFALIGALALVAISFLMVSLTVSMYESVDVAQRELVGVDMASPLLALTRQVRQQRYRSAIGDKADTSKTDSSKEWDAAVKAVDDADARHGGQLGTSAAWTKLKKGLEHARAVALQPQGQDVFATYSASLADLAALLALACDNSGLVLDPEFASYYVMDTAINRVPELAEELAQVRDQGVALYAARMIDDPARRALTTRTAILRKTLADAQGNLAKIAAAQLPIGPAMQTFSAALAAQVKKTIDVAEDDVVNGTFSVATKDYAGNASASIDEADRQLATVLMPSLRQLLEDRIARLNASFYRAAGVALLVVLLLAYLSIGAYVSITASLRRMADGARRMGSGDLSTRVQVRSHDELRQIAEGFNAMADSVGASVRDVLTSASTITSATREIAAGNLNLSHRTERQASSLEKTAHAIHDLTTTVRLNADHAGQSKVLAATASTVAQRAGSAVQDVVNTMNDIRQSSRKISEITGVIDSIAFQTNILALNAAVEAARAGEQGRGFAVVANEVRSLAQRSAQAAKEIRLLIESSVGKVEAGGKLVNQAGQTMEEVVASVSRVAGMIREIAFASDAQSQGIESVNETIGELDRMTQQNAALVEEAAASAESLNEHSERLTRAVCTFRVDEAIAG